MSQRELIAPLSVEQPAPAPTAPRSDGAVIATPYARSLARERGVDLATTTSGVVRGADVPVTAAASAVDASEPAASRHPAPAASVGAAAARVSVGVVAADVVITADSSTEAVRARLEAAVLAAGVFVADAGLVDLSATGVIDGYPPLVDQRLVVAVYAARDVVAPVAVDGAFAVRSERRQRVAIAYDDQLDTATAARLLDALLAGSAVVG
ncbi:MAG: E3 binding domain-containing protein [Microbacterium sp.]